MLETPLSSAESHGIPPTSALDRSESTFALYEHWAEPGGNVAAGFADDRRQPHGAGVHAADHRRHDPRHRPQPLELERIALEDEYFVSRRLYPNVDFYSGLIYKAMGYSTDYFTVLFALGRLPGWIAQWEEMLNDPEQKISRPRQVYVGSGVREFVPIQERT